MFAKRVTIFMGLLVWIAAARTAHAEDGLLVVGGNAEEHARTTVSAAIESAIRGAGWTLPAKPLSRKEADGLLKCPDAKSPWTCIPAKKGIGGAFVVSVDMIQSANGAPIIAVTGKMITTNPPSFAVGEQYCERCADDKLADAGTAFVQQLTRELARRSGRTVVVIKSIPSSGVLIFDGEQLGGTDTTFPTFPGKHTAMVQKPGYISELREFRVDEGKTAEITLTLRPSPAGPTRSEQVSSAWARRLPMILIGAGGLITIFGTVSLYQGQRDGGKYDYTRATAVGITTGVIGLGTAGTGLYLLWHRSNSDAPAPSNSSSGVALGWSGRF